MKEYTSIDAVPADDIPAALEFIAWREREGLPLSDETLEPLLNRQRDPLGLLAALASKTPKQGGKAT